MARPRKGTEETFFDTFADWDLADQAAALKVMEALHRQKLREERRNGTEVETPAEASENGN